MYIITSQYEISNSDENSWRLFFSFCKKIYSENLKNAKIPTFQSPVDGSKKINSYFKNLCFLKSGIRDANKFNEKLNIFKNELHGTICNI